MYFTVVVGLGLWKWTKSSGTKLAPHLTGFTSNLSGNLGPIYSVPPLEQALAQLPWWFRHHQWRQCHPTAETWCYTQVLQAQACPLYAIQDGVDTQLNKLESEGVLEKVSHSDWATPIVVAPKDGSYSHCELHSGSWAVLSSKSWGPLGHAGWRSKVHQIRPEAGYQQLCQGCIWCSHSIIQGTSHCACHTSSRSSQVQLPGPGELLQEIYSTLATPVYPLN